MTDAQDAANADERVARALSDENAPHVGWATRRGVIMWRCVEAHLAPMTDNETAAGHGRR